MATHATAIYDRSTVDTDALAAYLRREFDEAETTVAGRCVAAAKQWADGFCDNPFEDSDGEEVEIPEAVESAVLLYAGKLFLRRHPGLTREALGDMSQSFNLEKENQDLRQLLFPYRIIHGF